MEGFSTFVINTAFFRMDDGHNHPATNQPKRLKRYGINQGWIGKLRFVSLSKNGETSVNIEFRLDFFHLHTYERFSLVKCFASCAAGTLRGHFHGFRVSAKVRSGETKKPS